ncbi:MAG: serpin family protein [Oscillospiraceae bacterium]|nr:serpin family protein [Oscillospiraceae bacterium]
MKRLTAFFTALVLVLSLFSGCDAKVKAQDLTDGIQPDPVAVTDRFTDGQPQAVADFAAKLLRQSAQNGESVVISPLSVLYALAMTANGADGETLAQMESVFGLDIDTLNSYLYSTVSTLPSDVGYDIDIANSIWITDDEGRFVVNDSFVKTVKSYYDAGVFQQTFNDATLKDINNWVTQKTNGRIQDILDKIDEDAVMYLVNALNFEADWQNEYVKQDVWEGVFNSPDGAQNVDFMHENLHGYIENDDATGFVKYYKGREYAFVAMLPKQDIDSFVANLDGEKLTDLLENIDHSTQVITALPKFETTFGTEMSESFKNLGMTDAFDWQTADFSKMGNARQEGENVVISRIIHKAFIRVAEKGTQAGAATVVEMVTEGAMIDPPQPKEVILDRPFAYMIIDCKNNLPVFIGTVNQI